MNGIKEEATIISGHTQCLAIFQNLCLQLLKWIVFNWLDINHDLEMTFVHLEISFDHPLD